MDGSIENFRVSELLRTQGLERTPVESAGPGDIVAVAGVNDIMIGETIVDPDDPRPLPLIHVDDPAISMTFGINDSPLAGTEGKDHKLTARMIKDRLDRELIGNVSIKVLPTDAERTSAVFDLLLGDNLQGRKEHIAEHGAEYLDDLDVS